MSVKTERITILGSPKFKAFLAEEAKKESISISELVRQRCERKSNDADEELLLELVAEVAQATKRANSALHDGLQDAQNVLQELKLNERN